MKNSKKRLSFVTATMLSLSLLAAPSSIDAAGFKDVTPSQAAYEAITVLYENKVIDGYGDGTYRPTVKLTRGQAAKMIAGALKLDTSNIVDPKFKDVPTSHSFYPYIAVLKNNGIIDGYPDGRFGVNDPLNRGQMAKILSLAYELEEKPLENALFKDVDLKAFYANYLQSLIDLKITTGTTSSTFSPSKHVDRGQMALFIFRSEKAKGNLNPIPAPKPEPQPDPELPMVPAEQVRAAVESINAASKAGNWNSVSVEDFNKLGLKHMVTNENVETVRTFFHSYQRIEFQPVNWSHTELIKASDSAKTSSFVYRSPKTTDIAPTKDGAGYFNSQFKWGSLIGADASDGIVLEFSVRVGNSTLSWNDKIESFVLKADGKVLTLNSNGRTSATVFKKDELKNMELTVKFKDGIDPSVHYIDINVLKGEKLLDQTLFTYDFRELNK